MNINVHIIVVEDIEHRFSKVRLIWDISSNMRPTADEVNVSVENFTNRYSVRYDGEAVLVQILEPNDDDEEMKWIVDPVFIMTECYWRLNVGDYFLNKMTDETIFKLDKLSDLPMIEDVLKS
jgi:hypothetical protein